MLFGRFLMMIPLLAAAGSLAQKKLVPVSAGTFPTHGPLFVGLLVGVVVIVGALTFFPALSLGPDRRAFPDARKEGSGAKHGDATMTPPADRPRDDVTSLIPKKAARARPLFDPPIVKRAIGDSFVKLNPRTMMKNPVMFVVEVGAAHDHHPGWSATSPRAPAVVGFTFQITLWLWFTVLFANFAEAMAEGARQGAGRHAAQDQDRDHGAGAW